MGHTTLAYYIVGAHAFFSHRTYRIPFFQARLLDNQECHDNQECANADTERYAFGKLSARCFQRPSLLAPTLSQLRRRYRAWKIECDIHSCIPYTVGSYKLKDSYTPVPSTIVRCTLTVSHTRRTRQSIRHYSSTVHDIDLPGRADASLICVICVI